MNTVWIITNWINMERDSFYEIVRKRRIRFILLRVGDRERMKLLSRKTFDYSLSQIFLKHCVTIQHLRALFPQLSFSFSFDKIRLIKTSHEVWPRTTNTYTHFVSPSTRFLISPRRLFLFSPIFPHDSINGKIPFRSIFDSRKENVVNIRWEFVHNIF